jgi:hypothetical protein
MVLSPQPGCYCSQKAMADLRRFSLFADFLAQRFAARRVFDVAGGMGKLNEALTARGVQVVTFDRRHRHLDVPYVEGMFTLDQPCEAELVVGLHPDGATRVIIEYAARHRIAFAVVPCCSDNGMSYKPWMRHLTELARAQNFDEVGEQALPIRGRARVLYGRYFTAAQGLDVTSS